MNFKFLLLLLILFVPSAAVGIGGLVDSAFPEDLTVSLSLELSSTTGLKKETEVSGVLTIRNTSTRMLTIQNPANRQVLTFLVTDSLGNVVVPKFEAKSDPPALYIELDAGGEYTYSFKQLRFLTGSSLVGYQLESDKTYRVIASYRPFGPKGPGFTSSEIIVDFEKRTVNKSQEQKSTPLRGSDSVQLQRYTALPVLLEFG